MRQRKVRQNQEEPRLDHHYFLNQINYLITNSSTRKTRKRKDKKKEKKQKKKKKEKQIFFPN